MTPRRRLVGRLRASFFLKILLVFVLGFTAIGMYLAATYWYFDWRQERLTVRRTAMNYAQLILQEVGEPPDTTFARDIADRLGIGMRIEGPGVEWATDSTFPDFESVDLPPAGDDGAQRAGLSRALGFGADVRRGDYRYLLSLQAGSTGFGSESPTEELADAIFMVVLLACMYLATRYLLRPVRELSTGVDRLRQGDLNVEMRTRRTDELGQLMVSFNEMARAVRERLRARDQLLVDVSHEIRSPLTRMRVALEMMPDSAAKRSVVEDIEETEAMISVLLETERLDSPHGGLSLASSDLTALVRDTVEERADQEPGVDLTSGPEPVVAKVDAERVRLLVGNLISNALRHSDPQGPPVRVSVERAASNATITVKDCGVGISEEHLPRLFEPFYRVDSSRSKDTGGYGIGLSLVKRIVDAHGGSIDVESEVGQGTAVRVSLPLEENGHRHHGPRW
jgi:signal transduction histidine kinase